MTIMPSESRSDLAEREVVLGVDTHANVHVAVVLSAVGRLLGSHSFPTTTAGYRELIVWARGHGELRRAGVEGTGSYGAALTRLLLGDGVQVIEVNRPDRSARRRHGKSDLVDAEAAARAVLARTATASPKSADGPVEAMRILKLAKGSAVKARVQALNQLKAVLANTDLELRDALRRLRTQKLVTACADLAMDRSGADATVVASATVHTLRRLGRRIQYPTDEIRESEHRIASAVTSTAPQLLDLHGIGPDAAATLLITAGDNPERLTSEASFAALCGVSPVEASSGKTTEAETAKPTPLSIVPSSSDCAGTPRHTNTTAVAPPKGRRRERSSAA